MKLSGNGSAQVLANAARATHLWVIGQPGTGKSKLLEAMILQDILAGRGVGVIDPHGDLFRHLLCFLALLLARIPKLAQRVIVVDPCQDRWVVSLNPLEAIGGFSQERLALFLTDVVVKVWKLDPASTPRLVWLLTNSFLALAELGLALPDLPRLLLDTAWREQLLPRIRHEGVRAFFAFQFPRSEGAIHQWVTPVLNKIGGLVFDRDIRLLLAGKPTFSFRQVLDRGLVLLVNLSKGVLGEGSSALLGAFIVAHLQKAALARADTGKREPYYLYLDEFQNYTTDNIKDILSESRKYGLSLQLCHQYLDQLSPDLYSAVLNTTGTLVCFRVGYHDAWQLVKEVFPSRDFLASSAGLEIPLGPFGLWLPCGAGGRSEPLGWEGLAHLLANQAPREFWVRRRGAYLPLKQRTLDMPDPVSTPELEARLRLLLDTSGARYGRLKRDVERELGRGRSGPAPGASRDGRAEGQREDGAGLDDVPLWGS